MTAATVEPTVYTCSRCSRRSDETAKDWVLRTVPLVVAGVTLGICPSCAAGSEPPAEDDAVATCGGSCKGDYRPAAGTYYEASARIDGFTERWSCWDFACVEKWADEHYECDSCGHERDIRVETVTDGKRVHS